MSEVTYLGETGTFDESAIAEATAAPPEKPNVDAPPAGAIDTPPAEPPAGNAPAEPPPAAPSVPETPPPPAAPEPDYFAKRGIEGDQRAYAEKLMDALQSNTLQEFLSITQTDYKNMPAEQVFRRQIEKEFPGATEEEIDLVLARKLAQDFGITDQDEEANKQGMKLLEIQMRKVRDGFIADQQAYAPPVFEAAQAAAVDEQQEAARAKYVESVNANPVFKDLETSKTLTFGEGDNTFNFKLDTPETVRQQTVDPMTFLAKFDNPDGSLNAGRWAKTVAFSDAGDKIVSEAIAYGISKGRQERDAEMANATPAGQVAAPADGAPAVQYIRG